MRGRGRFGYDGVMESGNLGNEIAGISLVEFKAGHLVNFYTNVKIE